VTLTNSEHAVQRCNINGAGTRSEVCVPSPAGRTALPRRAPATGSPGQEWVSSIPAPAGRVRLVCGLSDVPRGIMSALSALPM
jgi:hypothetical protein